MVEETPVSYKIFWPNVLPFVENTLIVPRVFLFHFFVFNFPF